MRRLAQGRKHLVIAVALGTALAVAAPAAAKKPPKDPEPPPGRAGIEVSLDAQPVWVHELADELHYTVYLRNTTDADLTVGVTFTAGDAEDTFDSVEVPAGETVELAPTRRVEDFPESALCAVHETCMLTATAGVSLGDTLVADAAAETTLEFYDECDLAQLIGDICIWKPTGRGIYELTLNPTPPPNPNRTTNVRFTVRDHVPGNWCTTPPGSPYEPSGILIVRWRPDDGPVSMYVYLPDDGICLSGGAGGDFFPIGNPESFYLVADGTVEVVEVEDA